MESKMAGYLPDSDGAFDTWVENFVAVVTANPTNYGLTAAQVTPLTALLATWNTAYSDQETAHAAAGGATAAKTTAHDELAALVRQLVQIIQTSVTVTNEDKVAAGVPIRDTTKTPAPVPSTAPSGRIEVTNRLEHTLHFVDSATPTVKAKPAGVRGCQIWVKIGTTPPANASELTYLATDTSTPYVAQFEAADAGKTAYYWLRWENTRGQTGPWSAMISATIPG
jgi:hypothetical protein